MGQIFYKILLETGDSLLLETGDFLLQENLVLDDSLNISEDVSMNTSLDVNLSDSINISESVSLQHISNVSVADSINISESVSLQRLLNVSVADSVNISESTTVRELATIAYDTSSKSYVASATSLTWSHTCTGSNRLLFVVAQFQTGTMGTATVTYNGVSMTSIDYVIYTPNSAQGRLFYLVNPASGANNVVITASGSASAIGGYATSYTGTEQFGQPDGSNKQQGSTTISTNVTVTHASCWMFSYAMGFNSTYAGSSLSGSLTQKRDGRDDNGYTADSGGRISTGSIATGWGSLGANVGIIGASFAPSTAVEVSVSDSINISEDLTISVSAAPGTALSINVYDTLNISENLTITDDLTGISVYDSLSISEDITVLLSSPQISVFDSVAISENFVNSGEISCFIFDTLNISESSSGATAEDLKVSVSDSLNISENFVNTGELSVSTYDTLSITMQDSETMSSATINVYDALNITENITTLMAANMEIAVADIVNITEGLTLYVGVELVVTDVILITDNLNSEKPLLINVLEGVSIYDNWVVTLLIDVDTHDSISLSDNALAESFRFSPSPANSQPIGKTYKVEPVASAGKGSFQRPVGKIGWDS